MALTKNSKDALSKVSKQFFKDLKLNYRFIEDLGQVLRTIMKIFEAQDILMQSGHSCYSQNVKSEQMVVDQRINLSFIQFMMMNLCDRLSEEHQKFMFSLVSRKNYSQSETVDKFKSELLRMNELSSVLAHQDFEHCKFYSVRALRENQRYTRRLCEVVDHKIERAMDYQWQRSGASLTA